MQCITSSRLGAAAALTCLQLSSPELMRKVPNAGAVASVTPQQLLRRPREPLELLCAIPDTSKQQQQQQHQQIQLHEDKPASTAEETTPGVEGRKGAAGKSWAVTIGVFLLACALIAGIGLPLALELRSSNLLEARLRVVKKILSKTPLIDGHNNFAWNLRKQRGSTRLRDFPFDVDLSKNASWGPTWQTDLIRLRQGIVGAQFWSAYVPCEAQFLDAVKLTLEQIDVVRRLVAKYAEKMRLVTSSRELEQAHKDGVIASLVGIEGGHSIGASMAVLRSFYHLGARYMTLTHKCNTPWADSAIAEDPDKDLVTLGFFSDGLTSFGKAVVRELNRLGMLVDLSHVSVRTMRDALAVSTAPVVFSHSAARALCNSSSNVPDDVLRNLTLNGGLVMVSFDSAHLSCGDKASMHDVIAHINHIRKIAGVDHVGLGAGYDGISNPPTELPDVSGYPLLLAELTRDRRWPTSDIKKLVGGNLLRVLKEVEHHASTLVDQTPAEEWIPRELIEDTSYCRYLGV
ncbi:dipeptidase 1 isoform X1 [Nasonia vitripennis]|uniref:Dipeptidase n=2 Tax=Nasonia vitripennis TaxID=7425 RepID=A0A7M7QGZ7_NASVI|nr:dipeptidase 1 isoform X1 [Nasonia vitripennis]XP_031787421.1 dipeptidase 1 isoform X1 [Nasonia vitripennis]XP_031787422.1 dipeptidase 1 isoform X1 [Nasonia vitripennis]